VRARRLRGSLLIPTGGVRAESVTSVSHKRLLQGGYVQGGDFGRGLYAFLPLSVRVLNNIQNVVTRELEAVGCQQVDLPILSSKNLWDRTGRWDVMGAELMALRDRHDQEFCLSPTHEEAITHIVSQTVRSYRDLPLRVFQIGKKFRDEMRPRGGVLRAREFVMKDLYTFDATPEDAAVTYHTLVKAYESIFAALGVQVVKAEAHGGAIGGSLTHEFHVVSAEGEDSLAVCPDCSHAVNAEAATEEIGDAVCVACGGQPASTRGIEVAHTFLLGTRYSEAFQAGVKFAGASTATPMSMGCYGIGISRLLAAVVEQNNGWESTDDDGIVWPLQLAPYRACVVSHTHDVCVDAADRIYDALDKHDITSGSVVLDNRATVGVGYKLKDCERIGFPVTVVVGQHFQRTGDVEVLLRAVDVDATGADRRVCTRAVIRVEELGTFLSDSVLGKSL
jgi:prolyl-tRNA synthetase